MVFVWHTVTFKLFPLALFAVQNDVGGLLPAIVKGTSVSVRVLLLLSFCNAGVCLYMRVFEGAIHRIGYRLDGFR